MKNKVYDTWKNYSKHIWFKSTIKNDELIRNDLGDCLPKLENLEIFFNRKNLVEGIILTDQIARHIYRNNETMIKLYGEQAIFYVEEFCKYYQPKNNFELLFLCLPFRHYPNTNRMNKVYDIYNEYMTQYPNEKKYVMQLKKTTEKRYQIFLRNNKKLNADFNGNIFDKEILDHKSFNNMQFNLDKLISSFEYEYFSSKLSEEKFLLSLSGGIDSMVLLLLLMAFRKDKNLNFEAFHFNYLKRNESIAEEKYLQRFCNKNNITIHIVRIDKSDKNLIPNWENATKVQRYNNYKKILTERNIDSVILGHHADDIDENILMNLFCTGSANGNRFMWSDLSGMKSKQLINNVNIYRPFIDLDIRKKWILDLAKSYKVPYFKDSSFNLATRIRVRKELIPVMQNIFGDNIYCKLKTLNLQSKQLESFVKQKIKSYIKNENIVIELNYIFDSKIPILMSVCSVIDSIRNNIYKLNFTLPTHKSLINMLNIVINKKNVKKKIKFILNPSYYAIYNPQNMNITLHFLANK